MWQNNMCPKSDKQPNVHGCARRTGPGIDLGLTFQGQQLSCLSSASTPMKISPTQPVEGSVNEYAEKDDDCFICLSVCLSCSLTHSLSSSLSHCHLLTVTFSLSLSPSLSLSLPRFLSLSRSLSLSLSLTLLLSLSPSLSLSVSLVT